MRWAREDEESSVVGYAILCWFCGEFRMGIEVDLDGDEREEKCSSHLRYLMLTNKW